MSEETIGEPINFGPAPTPALNKALAAFQKVLPSIRAGQEADAGKYKYKYADLADINPLIMPLLGQHGLSWTTRPTMLDGQFVLRYELRHESGEQIEGLYPLHFAGGPQEVGKEITYARRYALCAVTGAAPGGDDDDGASAQQASQARSLPPQAQRGRAAKKAPPKQDVPGYGPNDPRSPRQSDKIFAMLGELGLEYKSEEGKAEVLALFGGWLERELSSTRDLTVDDARRVIDNLQIMLDTENGVDPGTGEVR